MNKAQFVEQKAQERLDEIAASKKTRKLKNQKVTRADKEKAQNYALGLWTRRDFDRRISEQNPDDWLTHDPVWNRKHPLYKAVNALIEQGASAPEAIRQAQESEIVIVPAYVATEKQVNFVGRLLDEREAPSGVKLVNLDDADAIYRDNRKRPSTVVMQDEKILGKRDASQLIDTLLKAPRKAAEQSDAAPVDGLDLSELPAGMYAVPNGDTRLKVRIEHGKPGTRWDGWTFVKDGAAYGQRTRYGMQKPGQPYNGKVEEALAAILEDPKAAIKAYGDLTEKCAMCNRKLEDKRSVELGIGPICEGKSELF